MPRFARWALAALVISACSSSDTTDPLSPQLWSTAAPSVTAGSSSIQLQVILARAGEISYSVYPAAQPSLTAVQVREDANGAGGRAPVRTGTVGITSNLVEDTVAVLLQGLTPAQAYYIYLAGTPATADPAPWRPTRVPPARRRGSPPAGSSPRRRQSRRAHRVVAM